MSNAAENFAAKIRWNGPQLRRCYAEWIMELEILAIHFARGACTLTCRGLALFPSFSTLRVYFETTPANKRMKTALKSLLETH